MRVQVCIIGAGPAGLLLSQLLHQAGIGSLVLEHRSRDRVETRIRAGVLEPGTVMLLQRAGVAARLQREGLAHDGFSLACDGESVRIDLRALTGSHVTIYGQTELTKDLIATVTGRPEGAGVEFEVDSVALHHVDGAAPSVTYRQDGKAREVACDFIAGCDGSHGVSRACIPADRRAEFERAYPFGWLGMLADVPPCAPELIYANHADGFALASLRSPSRSRYYVQAALDEDLAAWPDERLWDELARRLGPAASGMTRGPSLEKSLAPLRSFVAEPMRHGRLFLAGDAAHIVPPTGAKGLNLAARDVGLLADALITFYHHHEEAGLLGYSDRALARVWQAERFSWWFTGLTHRFPGMDAFSRRIQRAEFEHVRGSETARRAVAESYVGTWPMP